MELDDKYAPKPEEVVSFPSAKEVADFQTIVKDDNGTLKYYIMRNGKWYLIGNLTEV